MQRGRQFFELEREEEHDHLDKESVRETPWLVQIEAEHTIEVRCRCQAAIRTIHIRCKGQTEELVLEEAGPHDSVGARARCCPSDAGGGESVIERSSSLSVQRHDILENCTFQQFSLPVQSQVTDTEQLLIKFSRLQKEEFRCLVSRV